MKLISPRVAGDRAILRERFRSAQEVQDRGYVINGSGITFPGDGVRFTGAAGQRLVLDLAPSRTVGLTSFSAHCCFTPQFNPDDGATHCIWTMNPNYAWLWVALWAGGILAGPPGESFRSTGAPAAVLAVWRGGNKNWLTYSITNGSQQMFLNGVLVGSSSTAGIMPASGGHLAAALVVGSAGSLSGYNTVWTGTIHEIAWFDTTMTLEDHLDWMQGDTYREVWT